jgi:ABC-type transport system substrate-binding protein
MTVPHRILTGRRALCACLLAAFGYAAMHAPPAAAQPGTPAAPPKVLRYAFPVAETGFDPAQVSDIYSGIVAAHIFESPLSYDHLARPFKLKPSTAAAMPEVSDDFRTYVFRIRPGTLFADDPAFKGRPRELVAEDYVYALKRIADPAVKSPAEPGLEEEGIVGLNELRAELLKSGKPFDYDRPVEGLRALDRYTLRVQLRESRPRHIYSWTSVGAIAREVVEFYGDRIMDHPVGTGPFRLAEWRRSSRMVLERNPGYRDVRYDAEPNAGDNAGRALLARFKGRKLPMIDRVEIAVIEQAQPRWLAFLNAEQDLLERLPNEFIDQATPGGKVAPNLAKRGITAYRALGSDITLTVFNMEDALVGGYTPEKVALRRAISLATDVEQEIRLVRRGQAIAAQSIIAPLTSGYRTDLHTEMGDFSLPRAKALLDVYGYVDRDGDGWRDLPGGAPLVLEMATQSDQSSRQLDELWKKNMDALGLRVALKTAQWPENLKLVRSGRFMLWRVGSSSSSPDGQGAFERLYGPSIGKGNLARFRLPALDALFVQLNGLPDGPERQAIFDRATKLLVAYAPYRVGVHRVVTDLAYPWVVGYRRPVFWLDWWQYVDIDEAGRQRHGRR